MRLLCRRRPCPSVSRSSRGRRSFYFHRHRFAPLQLLVRIHADLFKTDDVVGDGYDDSDDPSFVAGVGSNLEKKIGLSWIEAIGPSARPVLTWTLANSCKAKRRCLLQ